MEKSFMDITADSDRIIYTPSDFARDNLLYLQEAGRLVANKPHSSHREQLVSYLLLVVTAGEGKVLYKGNEYGLKEGDCAFIDCNLEYTHITGSKPWSISWVHFYGNNVGAIYEKYIDEAEKYVFRPFSVNQISMFIDDLCIMGLSDDNIRDIRINEKLTSLLSIIVSEVTVQGRGRGVNARMKMQLQEIKEYIDTNYANHIELNELASKFYMNKFTMIRCFKEQYGTSPVAYLLQVRITKAKELLRFDALAIEEIAWKCGFSDANYFSRTFKKIEKATPGEYRKHWITIGEKYKKVSYENK